MKNLLLLFLSTLAISSSYAQTEETSTSVADQNPNYRQALQKYKSQQDKLVATMNSTIQETYKAYDWYEAKQERKQQRIADRRERRLYELQNWGNYYNPRNYFFDPFAHPYRYSPYRFNYGWRRWHW